MFDKTPIPLVIGATDGTPIGNEGDRLKVAASVTVNTDADSATPIVKQQTITITSTAEVALTGTLHTVSSGKKFKLTTFVGYYDRQAPIVFTLKKQTGGVGAWVECTPSGLVNAHPSDKASFVYEFPLGLNLGVAGDKFQVFAQSGLKQGYATGQYTGLEFNA